MDQLIRGEKFEQIKEAYNDLSADHMMHLYIPGDSGLIYSYNTMLDIFHGSTKQVLNERDTVNGEEISDQVRRILNKYKIYSDLLYKPGKGLFFSYSPDSKLVLRMDTLEDELWECVKKIIYRADEFIYAFGLVNGKFILHKAIIKSDEVEKGNVTLKFQSDNLNYPDADYVILWQAADILCGDRRYQITPAFDMFNKLAKKGHFLIKNNDSYNLKSLNKSRKIIITSGEYEKYNKNCSWSLYCTPPDTIYGEQKHIDLIKRIYEHTHEIYSSPIQGNMLKKIVPDYNKFIKSLIDAITSVLPEAEYTTVFDSDDLELTISEIFSDQLEISYLIFRDEFIYSSIDNLFGGLFNVYFNYDTNSYPACWLLFKVIYKMHKLNALPFTKRDYELVGELFAMIKETSNFYINFPRWREQTYDKQKAEFPSAFDILDGCVH